MKTRQRIAVQYFLRTLKKKMENEKVSEIIPVWKMIFSREELEKIVRWLYLGNIPEGIEPDKMDGQELLEAIADDYLILGYILEQMDKELEAFENPTDESVQSTLKQLSMETHYLAIKPIALWDEYDSANYKAISSIAGNPVPMYGLFNALVTEEEKYLVAPLELHEKKQDAQSSLFMLIATGTLEDTALKIMML